MILAVLLVLDALVMGAAWVLRQEVVPGWKKGPLIDPAAPYAPENAVVLFAAVACVVANVYVLALAAWRRRHAANAWVPFAALLAGVGLAEGGMRLYLTRAQVTYFRPHPTLHWQVRPNLRDFPNLTAEGTTITTNADGMRMVDEPREKGPDEFRILVLGDSSNFGHGVGNEETWSFQLEKLIGDRMPGKRVHVLNGACPGWTTYQANEFLESIGLAYAPDMVIAGFNNDPGPEYFGDRARVMSGPVRAVNGVLFRLETYLLAREFTLSAARRLFPAKDVHYTARVAGETPNYGKLGEGEDVGLVPRVPLDEFLANVKRLNETSKAHGARFAWIDMPINRSEPDLVERYVNYEYRTAVEALAEAEGFPLFDVDARWLRTREPELHCLGHVHHPCKTGHLRMAQQIGHELAPLLGLSGDVAIEGPPPAPDEATLRFGYSTFTPVHAHVGAVLEAMPELAAEHGLALQLQGYQSGGPQGDDVGKGALDAFFTCEVPAIQMVGSRVDQRIVASPGELGRVALIARVEKPTKVGFAPGSTTAMDWQTWGAGAGATDVPLKTDELEAAMLDGRVDAVVAWDPWAEEMVREHGWTVLKERTFRSAISLSVPWATYEPGRGERLVALIGAAMRVAAADRPRWDAVVADKSGWPVEIVRAVADRNAILSGRGGSLALADVDREGLARALAFARMPNLTMDTLVAPEILAGRWPTPRLGGGTKSAKGAPKIVISPGMGPPQGPPPGAPGGPPLTPQNQPPGGPPPVSQGVGGR
ncbi:MAG: hypothetical protein ACOZNI_22745 [Myxococcota bacterium]